MSVRGRRVVITGGAGFIGSHLVDRLCQDAPASLVVVDDLSTGRTENLAHHGHDVDLLVGDVGGDAAASAIGGADLVLHLAVRNVRASIGRPMENFEVNATGTLRVLEAIRSATKATFVYVSSSEVYGTPATATFRETTLPEPTTVYGAGKLAGEHLTLAYGRTYGVPVRVVRPFNSFGPRSHFEGDSGEVIPKFVLRALAGRPLQVHGDGSQTRDFSYVEDTAAWIAELAVAPDLDGTVLNVGSGREISILDLAHMVLDATGSASAIQHLGPRPGDLPRLVADMSKTRQLADVTDSIDFKDGLQRTIAHFAAQDVERLLDLELERNWQ